MNLSTEKQQETSKMGACFNSVKVNTPDRMEAKKRFLEIQETDLLENGHSYSGTIGMANGIVFKDKTFPTEYSAIEYIEDTAEKWGPAVAVRVTDPDEDFDGWVIGAICAS